MKKSIKVKISKSLPFDFHRVHEKNIFRFFLITPIECVKEENKDQRMMRNHAHDLSPIQTHTQIPSVCMKIARHKKSVSGYEL